MTGDLDKPMDGLQAHPIFDPALPDAVTAAVADLAAGYPRLLADDADAEHLTAGYFEGGRILRTSLGCGALGGAVALAPWLLKQLSDDQPQTPDAGPGRRTESIDAAAHDFLDIVQNTGLLLLVGGTLIAALVVAVRIAENRRMAKALRRARGHYVHPSWLTGDAVRLLARAQHAADTILGSRLHLDDMEGLGAANRVQVPDRVWSLARSLHRYSRAVNASTGADGAGGAVVELLAGEREALDTVRTGIELQVAALEVYARQVQEVDRIAAQGQTMEQLAARGEALLDLVAETAAAQGPADEITPLTARAALVADALTEALASAKAAAADALPPGR
ncbi:hypothetical protein [Kitasatospora sp. NPDC057223]|uniref:hypothetical protein n=1 Tax=Kitasatospora sp. NPDC057223 TaxID=3346055 RepID=UPI0036265C42